LGNLPVPETSFVGRERELAAVRALLERPDARLVVLTGPGGVGKTRLALAAAGAVADHFRGGAVFVDLSPLSDPARFLPEIAAVVGAPETDERPVLERLRAALRGRRLLLVLDNFETVVGAATDLGALLNACRSIIALVTSRTRIGLPGEVTVPVEPLLLAPTDPAEESEAVRLFVDRARQANPEIEMTPDSLRDVRAICARLDGLPLAIELAAARLRSWSPMELAVRLGNPLDVLAGGPEGVPVRLRTIRDAIAWSYALLPQDLQALVRRLAVFRGGFDAQAAEAVAGSGESGLGRQLFAGDQASIAHLNRLNLLADHHLIRFEPMVGMHRFAMLEVVREFGWDRLREAGELATTRRAHAEYFLERAERTHPLVFTRGFRQAMASLIVDQHNYRSALSWARESGETAVRLRLCVALWEFWYQCGFIAEGRAEVEAALVEKGGTPAERRPALGLAGFLAWLQGDNEEAERRYGEEMAAAKALGNPWFVAACLNGHALIAWRTGDTASIRRYAGTALPVLREVGDPIAQAISLVALAIADRLDGRLDEAAALFEQGRRLAEQTGFLWLAAAAGFGAGEVALDRERDAEAADHCRQSLAITADLGDRWGMGAAIGGIACVAARRGLADRAAELFAAADALLASGRTFLPTLNRARYERLKTAVRDEVGPRAFARLSATGRAWPPEEAADSALGLAEVLAAPAEHLTRGPVRLTPREREVLCLLVEGRTDGEIALALGLKRRSVSARVSNRLRIGELPGRASLAPYAVRQHVV
jgi:predicted ATPase/DNA-binding CsgD family transcriptional regulator